MGKNIRLVVMCILIVILAACTNTEEVKVEEIKGEEQSESITITDSTGKEITINLPIRGTDMIGGMRGHI